MPPPLPPDLHVHTNFSIDAEGTQIKCVDSAVEAELPGVGFAEHWDFDPRDPSTGRFDYREHIDPVLEAIIDAGMVIEINTRGWRSEAREQYPSADILKRYKQ